MYEYNDLLFDPNKYNADNGVTNFHENAVLPPPPPQIISSSSSSIPNSLFFPSTLLLPNNTNNFETTQTEYFEPKEVAVNDGDCNINCNNHKNINNIGVYDELSSSNSCYVQRCPNLFQRSMSSSDPNYSSRMYIHHQECNNYNPNVNFNLLQTGPIRKVFSTGDLQVYIYIYRSDFLFFFNEVLLIKYN